MFPPGRAKLATSPLPTAVRPRPRKRMIHAVEIANVVAIVINLEIALGSWMGSDGQPTRNEQASA